MQTPTYYRNMDLYLEVMAFKVSNSLRQMVIDNNDLNLHVDNQDNVVQITTYVYEPSAHFVKVPQMSETQRTTQQANHTEMAKLIVEKHVLPLVITGAPDIRLIDKLKTNCHRLTYLKGVYSPLNN